MEDDKEEESDDESEGFEMPQTSMEDFFFKWAQLDQAA